MADQENTTGFLTDDSGNPSSIRFMSWVSFVHALFLSTLYALGKAQGDKIVDIIFVFIFGAFAPKVIQKFAERWSGGK